MKKPVTKKKIGGVLGKISPLAMLINAAQSDKKDKRGADGGPSGLAGPSAPSGVGGMKAGGKVTRGDGACMKGHTKGAVR
jgi:hypothetical protein